MPKPPRPLSGRGPTGLRIFALVVLCAVSARAQDDPLRAAPNGLERAPARLHALVGATLHRADGTVVENATIFIEGERFGWVRSGVAAPAGAVIHDLSGKHLWPGLIEPCLEIEVPRADQERAGAHWNSGVTPDRSVLASEGPADATRSKLRKIGFTAAGIAPEDGAFAGFAAVISLNKPSPETPRRVHRETGYQMVDFIRGSSFPRSQMGNIALQRQVLSDAVWTREHGGDTPSVLRALPQAGADAGLPLWLFDTDNELELLRVAKVLAEAGLSGAALRGSGREHERLGAVVAALEAGGHPLVLPLSFPDAPTLKSAADVDAVELSTLMRWERAPSNPQQLIDAGLRVLLTSVGNKGTDSEFHSHAERAIERGLDPARVLAMLTTEAASFLGVADRLGQVAEGFQAHLVVTDGPLFQGATKVLAVWIDGIEHELETPQPAALSGTWNLTFAKEARPPISIEVKGKGSATAKRGESSTKAQNWEWDGEQLSFALDASALNGDGRLLFSGLARAAGTNEASGVDGQALLAGGQRIAFSLRRAPEEVASVEVEAEENEEVTSEEGEADSAATDPSIAPQAPAGLPFGPYGLNRYPNAETLVFRNVTLWTSAAEGIIENGGLVARDGRILFVGKAEHLDAFIARAKLPEMYRTIDGQGLHLTPGLIDCHSHTGISGGVNEGTQAVTAEVRIQDVTDPNDISWYRQLAGGVTTVNQLHGSANPIGGQSQTVKVRWGVDHPDDMHLSGAMRGIKFALGENVKRSNGTRAQTRYPATRMGVQALIEERFRAARRYAREKARRGASMRRDLELEALAEILAGERLIHCHSYRQDEILMLCHIAKQFGFRIGTFQHVLEGYKVAPEIAEVAIGASAFSDWWQYKIEVQDAIPWAGAIMHEAGVCVSFNSDSDELARRMNLEAAKAVRYGGLTPNMALRFVTINPAKQLGIDQRVGSLEAGKDADLALWTTNPLSTRARCAATWVDGRPLFSLEADAAHRAHISGERKRLIELALASGGSKTKKAAGSDRKGSIQARASWRSLLEDATREHFLDLIRRGFDPRYARCGDCGALGR